MTILPRVLLPLALLSSAIFAACEQAPFPSAPAAVGGSGGSSSQAGAAAGGSGGGAAPDPLLAIYPTAGDFFAQAVVPSCAEELSCHGGRAAPSLRTFADLEATFGARCQQTVADARAVVDLCEAEGDGVDFGAGQKTARILGIDVDAAEPVPPTRVSLRLDAPVPSTIAADLVITRSPRSDVLTPTPLAVPLAAVVERFGNTLVLDLGTLEADKRGLFDERDYPRGIQDVKVWDPNRNGVIGATLGGRQAVRGDVRRSYLYQRLLSDDLGSRMPLLPGTWSADATRAMGCFLRSPVPADAPLDLTDCPVDPGVPGKSKLASLLSSQCATSGCHDDAERAGALSLVPDEGLPERLRGLYATQVRTKLLVDPAAPDASYLMCKITPGCGERLFDPMPQGRAALSEEERAIVRAWIAADLPVP